MSDRARRALTEARICLASATAFSSRVQRDRVGAVLEQIDAALSPIATEPAPLYYVTRFTLDGRHAVCEVATGRVLIRDLDAALSSDVAREARDAVLEEAARVCDRLFESESTRYGEGAVICAHEIRALATLSTESQKPTEHSSSCAVYNAPALSSIATEPDRNAALTDVLEELERATRKFPTWPTDPLHAVAVLGEEFGELTKAALQLTYESHKTSAEEVRTEAIQTAAMALRFAMSLDVYVYQGSAQHEQGAAIAATAATKEQGNG